MAIVRKLNEITLTFDGLGNVSVRSTAVQIDDADPDNTPGGWNKIWNAPAVKTAGEALRDAVVAQAAGQGKPLTF